MKAEKDKKTGKWLIQYRYTDWQGKRRKSTKRGFATKREAEEWLRNFLITQKADFDMKFEDFWKIYCADMETRLREHTMRTKKYIVELKILPYFGNKRVNDITAAEYCLKNGWKVFLRFDLHVKTYVVDYKRGIVGSANATNSGLGMSKVPNLEMATLVDMDSEDIKKINKLYEQAVPVDIELLELMKAEIENVNNEKTSESFSWSQDIAKRFNPTIETLFSHELPETDTIDGYLQFLDADFGGDKTSIKNVFRWSTSYLWLLQTVKGHDGEIYFGELSSILHNTIVSDPKPYRKDVKLLLANLLSIVEELDMDELIIDRPSHSQRVRLAK